MSTRRLAVLLFVSGATLAQTNPPATEVKPRITVQAKPAPPQPAFVPTLPTVEAFMHRMFGQDPNIKWKIVEVGPSQIPNVAKLVVLIGDDPRPTTLYVMPDGQNAIVGDVIPFGAEPFEATRKKLAAEGNGHRRGAANASLLIFEFSDLQCPHCKAAQPIIDKLLTEFPSSQLIFQHFPLANHKWAAKAAMYAECVAEQDPRVFWKFVQAIYDQQEQIAENEGELKLRNIAASNGVLADQAATCASRSDIVKKVQDSVILGRAVGVSGTPTLFVNGRKLGSVTDMPYDSLKQMVQFELDQAQKATTH